MCFFRKFPWTRNAENLLQRNGEVSALSLKKRVSRSFFREKKSFFSTPKIFLWACRMQLYQPCPQNFCQRPAIFRSTTEKKNWKLAVSCCKDRLSSRSSSRDVDCSFGNPAEKFLTKHG